MHALAVGLALAAIGCTGAGDGLAPSATGPTHPLTTASNRPERTSSANTSESSSPPTSVGGAAGELTADEVTEVNRFMERFLDLVWRDDPTARTLWSGYPEHDALADAAFDGFLEEFEWVKSSDDIGWWVDASAGFSTMPVVTITDHEREACSLVLSLGSKGVVIQRLPTKDGDDRFEPAPFAMVAPGEVLTVSGVPVEGGARAYLYGTELQVRVDHETQSMSVTLPDRLPEVVILTLTTATPEIPAAVAVVYRS